MSRGCLSFLLVLVAAAVSSRATARTVDLSSSLRSAGSDNVPRWLEENNYSSSSSNNMMYSKCVRVKVPNDNDDEGNSYFYNGRYHAQYQIYAAFVYCSESDRDQCGDCDFSTEYVTDLDTYLQSGLTYIQSYCSSCASQCGGSDRRLEDQQQNNNNGYGGYNSVQADCSTCSSICENVNYSGYGGNDESAYLECQEAYEGGDGLQYYAGPQCDDGEIVIGLYYDDECTVKTKAEADYGLSYDTFRALESVCVDCSSSNGFCSNLAGEALQCKDGRNVGQQEEDDDMPICRSVKAAASHFYRHRRKRIAIVPLLLLLVVLSAGFMFGAYTYYVRHRNSVGMHKAPLASLDHTQSDLPPLS